MVLAFALNSIPARAQDSTFFEVLLPYVGVKGGVRSDLFYRWGGPASRVPVSLSCYRMGEQGDSLCVFKIPRRPLSLVQGTGTIPLYLKTGDDSLYLQPDIAQVLKQTRCLPCGSYHLSLMVFGDTPRQYCFRYRVDSALSANGAPARSLQQALSPDHKLRLAGLSFSAPPLIERPLSNASVLAASGRRIHKLLGKKGYTVTSRSRGSSLCYDLYYKSWYLGYYSLDTSSSIIASIAAQKKAAGQLGEGIKTELEDLRSLFTQLREKNETQKEEKQIQGEIGIDGYASGNQEEGSGQDNNYYELHGRMELPLMDIPVSLEGFYTSQDKHRKVKASYIRLHYDFKEENRNNSSFPISKIAFFENGEARRIDIAILESLMK